MATTVTETIQREHEDIEKYRTGLLQQAQMLAMNIDPVTKLPIAPDQTLQSFLGRGQVPQYDQSGQLTGYAPGGGAYQVAGFSQPQIAAMQAATGRGVGAYDPYLQQGRQALNAAYSTMGEAADVLRGADTRQQYLGAQAALGQAGTAAGSMGAGIAQLGQYSQANLAPAAMAYGMGMQGLSAAQRQAMGAQPDFGQAQGTITGGLGMGQQAVGMAQSAAMQPGFGLQSELLGRATGAAYQAGPSDFSAESARLRGASGTGQYAADMAALASQQQGFGQGVGTALAAAQEARLAAAQPGFMEAERTLGQGIAGLGAGTQAYRPEMAQGFMDPYRQQVIDETMKQINRQAAIAQQGQAAQAVRAGAFGGTREGVQRAEMERNVLDQKASTIANLLSQGYSQAQANAMATFEQQQQRQMQAGAGIGQLGTQQASVAAQRAGLGQSAAQQLGQAGQLMASTAGQQGQLGLAAAQQQFQQAGFDAQTAMQLAQLQQTQQQQAAQQSQLYSGIGQMFGQQASAQGALGQQAAQIAAQQASLGVQAGSQLGSLEAQRAQLGQAGAGLYGNLSAQQIAAGQGLGQLGVQQAQLGQAAGQGIANIYGQQAGLYQNLGQGIGNLAAQQFGIGQQMASGLGGLGAQAGQLGVQYGAMGQTAQQMGQGDINFLYNIGQAQQAQTQQQLDAARSTAMQQMYTPYQQAAFLSDIYRGAPSTQMATSIAQQPSPSPFQQVAGTAIGVGTAYTGAKKAGLFGP